MVRPSIPANESKRLAHLQQYDILDTFFEKDYDDITKLAAAICNTPVSLITLVDEQRQWFKSRQGLNVNETEREYAFCAHALNNPQEILIVPDSRKDTRFENNPLVTDDPHVIFYTGVPLVNPEGYALGTLCVIDHKPRTLSDEQLASLKILSNQVMNLLELRKANNALKKTQHELELRNKELEQFASVVSHDIKSPLTNIFIASQILQDDERRDYGEADSKWVSIIKNSAEKIKTLVNGILAYYQRDSFGDHNEKINLAELITSIIGVLPSGKPLEINYPQTSSVIFINKIQLEQIFLNLLNNSIRYNTNDIVRIDIQFTEDEEFYNFSVSDNGIGIAENDREKIFTLFTSLNSQQVHATKSYGIGLSTVKRIIERNLGKITVQSKVGEGSIFSFSLKKPTQ